MKVDAVRTPVSREVFARALVVAWWRILQTPPTRQAILLLVAQSAFETGWWAKMHCFNAGNAKSHQKAGDWYFVACNEYLDPALADAMLANAGKRPDGSPNVELGGLIDLAKKGDKPRLRRLVRLLPDHPGSAFRAFATLEDGIADHLSLIAGQYAAAFAFLATGDTRGFVKALGEAGYFTDGFEHYFATVNACIRMIDGLPIDLSPPAPDTSGALAAAQDASLRDLSWSLIEDK